MIGQQTRPNNLTGLTLQRFAALAKPPPSPTSFPLRQPHVSTGVTLCRIYGRKLRSEQELCLPFYHPQNPARGSTRLHPKRAPTANYQYGERSYRFVKILASKMNDQKSGQLAIKRMMDAIRREIKLLTRET